MVRREKRIFSQLSLAMDRVLPFHRKLNGKEEWKSRGDFRPFGQPETEKRASPSSYFSSVSSGRGRYRQRARMEAAGTSSGGCRIGGGGGGAEEVLFSPPPPPLVAGQEALKWKRPRRWPLYPPLSSSSAAFPGLVSATPRGWG